MQDVDFNGANSIQFYIRVPSLARLIAIQSSHAIIQDLGCAKATLYICRDTAVPIAMHA